VAENVERAIAIVDMPWVVSGKCCGECCHGDVVVHMLCHVIYCDDNAPRGIAVHIEHLSLTIWAKRSSLRNTYKSFYLRVAS
jgi:hypothetical protein